MFHKLRMLITNKSLSIKDTMVQTKDGESNISMERMILSHSHLRKKTQYLSQNLLQNQLQNQPSQRQSHNQLLEATMVTDSKLVNHSTLSQQCLKSMSLKPLVIILSSEYTTNWEQHKSSGSMIRRRLSDHTNGRTNVLKFKQMVPTGMLEWLIKSVQAGGKRSEMKMVTLWMIAS